MTWVLLVAGWLVLAVAVTVVLALILRGRSRFNPPPSRLASTRPPGRSREELSISVLVADDDDRLRALLLDLLRTDPRFGRVNAAADGHQTLALARRERPDVLLLDVQMPIMTGVALLPLLDQIRPAPAVMLYTADPAAPALQAARQFHPHYLTKSTPLDVVIDEVAALGASRQLSARSDDAGRRGEHHRQR